MEVVDFPAFIAIDDKGNDFFKELHLDQRRNDTCINLAEQNVRAICTRRLLCVQANETWH
jgi:hypothetical protein